MSHQVQSASDRFRNFHPGGDSLLAEEALQSALSNDSIEEDEEAAKDRPTEEELMKLNDDATIHEEMKKEDLWIREF